ncbi:MAG TPA: DNA polymerase/3'-5' exonuclease PolX [Candidatus Cybelea sp.]|nr:DNA polymerase/3'-5' exonuclease PolX [Candidatus Cybelea sp.]
MQRLQRVHARNDEIAAMFDHIGDLLEIEAANPFRVRAYRNAARTLRGLKEQVADMLAQGADLSELPGIGKDLAGKIREVTEKGRIALQRELERQMPGSVTELLRVPGLGPKRVRMLHDKLGIVRLDQLKKAAEAGKLAALPGFGRAIEQRVLGGLAAPMAAATRMLLAVAKAEADALVAYLRQAPGIDQVIVAGSYRRARETVGDLDILATAKASAKVIAHFATYDRVRDVLASGPTRATVTLRNNLQVDLRVVAKESYGAALVYFTGSKAHNIRLRRMGQDAGLKINEYGVYRGRQRIAGATEASVYRSIGLPYIAPELREERGEIEAAKAHALPKLVEPGDLRGDLHCHTNASDGNASLADMASAARAAGLEYLAITEHSRHLAMTHGLDPRRLAKQLDEIDRLNGTLKDIVLLKGVEVDILEDGSLDLPDSVLGKLDLVIGALHSHLTLPAEKQTARILRAMDHRHFTILAHPSGRLLGSREASAFDVARIIRAAKERGCFLELNAQPERLDLTDVHCQAARAEGVLISIASDAHSIGDFANLGFGVGQARRGWLEKADVLNTRTLAKLKPLLARTM